MEPGRYRADPCHPAASPALISQLPAGWLVDMVPSKRRAAMLAIVGIGISAFLIALHALLSRHPGRQASARGVEFRAGSRYRRHHARASVGHAAVGPRLGRNARFASIGNGLAAGVMGATGYLISPQAVFLVTAVLALPTLLALAQIRESDIDSVLADGGIVAREPRAGHAPVLIGQLLRKRSLLVLTFALFLFHAANAAMLPLVGTEMAMRSDRFVLPILGREIDMGQWASALVAVCIVVPQLMVALIAPGVGRLAVHWGRRPVLLVGLRCAAGARAILAFNSDPWVIVAAQMLDGICGAVLECSCRSRSPILPAAPGRFNLAQGIAASATGVGAALSTAVAGYLAAKFGSGTAFLGLAITAAAAFVTLLVAMPETAPKASMVWNRAERTLARCEGQRWPAGPRGVAVLVDLATFAERPHRLLLPLRAAAEQGTRDHPRGRQRRGAVLDRHPVRGKAPG